MTPTALQMAMPFVDATNHAIETPWLGLAIGHRRLFDALQDGWLRPVDVRGGVLIGIGAYSLERDAAPTRHPISVRLKLNPAKLPALDAVVLRNEEWTPSRAEELESSDTALYWPGVLPTFAISEISVSTAEERARLTGIARSVSNVDLPELPLRVGTGHEKYFEPSVDPPDVAPKLVIPDNEDTIRGALSMAIWGIPKIDPWMDLLVTSFASDQSRLPFLAANVEAPWWRFPPWLYPFDHSAASGPQECLWLAAIEVLQTRHRREHVGARELADRIARIASEFNTSEDSLTISKWRDSTYRLLRAESIIQIDNWRDSPVGLAVQMVLSRPEPIALKEWFRDLPNLPPAVAWSAATLCGLHWGYTRLDSHFRGGPIQRELLSVHALHLSSDGGCEGIWPSIGTREPKWRKEGSDFVVSWGNHEFARKREKVRGRWFAANLEDARVVREAQKIAKARNWPCIRTQLTLTDSRIPLNGPGRAILVDSESSQHLNIEGRLQMEVPIDSVASETLNFEEFRRFIAIEPGPVPGPPPSKIVSVQIEYPGVPGLLYVPAFLTSGEEEALVASIDRSNWQSSGIKRRVQHYGWRYDYRFRKIDTSMRLGPLPNWASRIARRLVSTNLLHHFPDQVIVNEYIGAQGIHNHIDHIPSFADGIVMISLLESWEMIFTNPLDKRKVHQILERGSAAVMSGEARYRWKHGIPRRKFEQGKVKRGRRISLTFRKVLPHGDR